MEDTISVVKVHNILMVTMPYNPDDEAISMLQDKVLMAMEKYEAKGLVLDISTVDSLDSFFARTITETAQMVSVMGGRMIIAGMRPSVAFTATELGLTFGSIETTLSVDNALDNLENSNNRSIK